jgi:hypothetical protein
MRALFLVKESIDTQHWTSNGKRYNIGKLYSWVRQNGHEVEIIPLDRLRDGYRRTKTDEEKESGAFWRRAEVAGDEPILVAIDEKDRWWICDGNHRFARAERDGLDSIEGYVVLERDLPQDAIEPKE